MLFYFAYQILHWKLGIKQILCKGKKVKYLLKNDSNPAHAMSRKKGSYSDHAMEERHPPPSRLLTTAATTAQLHFCPPFSLIFPQELIDLTVRIIQANDKLEWTLVQGDSDGYGAKFITESPHGVVVKELFHRKYRTLEPHHQTSHLPKDRLTLLMCFWDSSPDPLLVWVMNEVAQVWVPNLGVQLWWPCTIFTSHSKQTCMTRDYHYPPNAILL